MYIIYLLYSIFTLHYTLGENNEAEKISYCTHPDCPLDNQHTMCVAANKQSKRLYASGMTTWMRYQILLLHNRHRDNVAMGLEAGQPPASNMRKMYWDYELEKSAELWARQCQKRHDECRNTIRFNVLQNIDVRPIVARVTESQLLADAVGAWFSGSRVLPHDNVWFFRRSNCSAPGGCNAHWYSAAAWASTWRLGCSQALCTAKKRSCAVYRKRRRTDLNSTDTTDNSKRSITFTTPKNLLRRTNHMTTLKVLRLQNFITTVRSKIKESPLHRGVSGIEKERRDVKIIAYTVCNYGPAGNIEGYPIYDAGTTCSSCPQGTHCKDSTHRGLCSVVNDPSS